MASPREEWLMEMGIRPLWRLREPMGGSAASNLPPSATALPLVAESKPDECSLAETVGELPSGSVTRQKQIQVEHLDWDALEETVRTCSACALCRQRKQAVPGVGDRTADWLFIGEGPGAEEDIRGEPFVGQAGKLLDAMLAALGLMRGEGVYIANAVKCRPPGNRTPEPDEMAACRPYLLRQIALIRPKIIVLLGRAAVYAVLGESKPLSAMRSTIHFFGDVPVVVTYHPAYLLRNLPEKAKAWEDLLLARRQLKAGSAKTPC